MTKNKIVGITFGSFDLCHYGHVLMFEECKEYCDYLIVGVQSDPSIDRPEKNKPVQSHEERVGIISSLKFVFGSHFNIFSNFTHKLLVAVPVIGHQ